MHIDIQEQRPTSVHRPKRSRVQRAADLHRIEELHVAGHPAEEIARVLSQERQYTLSRSQISYDLETIRAAWLEQAQELFAGAQARTIAKLRVLEREGWQQWRETKSPSGARIVLEAIDRQAKVLGLYTERREVVVASKGACDQPGPISEDEQIELIERHLARVRERRELDAKSQASRQPGTHAE